MPGAGTVPEPHAARKGADLFAQSCQLWTFPRHSASVSGQVCLSNGNVTSIPSLVSQAPVWPPAKRLEHSARELRAVFRVAVSFKTLA